IQDEERDVRESPYTHVEIFWPLELCRNNVEIIDSPGLNENEVREKVATDYLRRVDAVLFVVTALRLGPSMHEAEAIANLKEAGHEEIFFIVNRFDQLQMRDRDQVRQRALIKLAPLTKRANALHFISSLDALEGRLKSDDERLGRSGLLELEQELKRFLVQERGRIKLLRAASELRVIIHRTQSTIPEIENLLKM